MRMEKFNVAVKAFIVNDNDEILLVKRSDDDVHKPGVWEVPGGRLDHGENPFEGLKRETLEETGIDIDVRNPLRIHHFTREDGGKITMITFYCRTRSKDVKLSDEHTDFIWIDIDGAYSKIVNSFQRDIAVLRDHFL